MVCPHSYTVFACLHIIALVVWVQHRAAFGRLYIHKCNGVIDLSDYFLYTYLSQTGDTEMVPPNGESLFVLLVLVLGDVYAVNTVAIVVYPFAFKHAVFPLSHLQIFVWCNVEAKSVGFPVVPMTVVEAAAIAEMLPVAIRFSVFHLADIVPQRIGNTHLKRLVQCHFAVLRHLCQLFLCPLGTHYSNCADGGKLVMRLQKQVSVVFVYGNAVASGSFGRTFAQHSVAIDLLYVQFCIVWNAQQYANDRPERVALAFKMSVIVSHFVVSVVVYIVHTHIIGKFIVLRLQACQFVVGSFQLVG